MTGTYFVMYPFFLLDFGDDLHVIHYSSYC